MTGGNVYDFPAGRYGDRDGASAKAPVEEFQPFFASEMQGREPRPRQWIIDGLIMRRTVCLVSGAPKIGKSLLLQQALTAAATAGRFLDRPCVGVNAFGLFGEDDQDELERRQAEINVLYDRDPADLELSLSWESRLEKDARLVEFEYGKMKFTPLWDQVWNHVDQYGVELIALDTARVIFGGKEIDPAQVTLFMRALGKEVSKRNAALILSAHPAKNDPRGFSGTTAWLASARFGLSLGRPETWEEDRDGLRDGRRVIRGLGANYGTGLNTEHLMLENGVFVPAEAERRQGGVRGPLTAIERQDLAYRLLAGVKRVMMNGAEVFADPLHRLSMANRARRSTEGDVNRIALNDLYAAQEDLVNSGQLVRVDVSRKCLLRPSNGPYYQNEKPWQPNLTPKSEAAD